MKAVLAEICFSIRWRAKYSYVSLNGSSGALASSLVTSVFDYITTKKYQSGLLEFAEGSR